MEHGRINPAVPVDREIVRVLVLARAPKSQAINIPVRFGVGTEPQPFGKEDRIRQTVVNILEPRRCTLEERIACRQKDAQRANDEGLVVGRERT